MRVNDRSPLQMQWCAYATWTNTGPVLKPFDGLLGLRADEGRAKQRYAPCRRKEPLIRGSPNGTSYHPMDGTPIREEEPAELKHLSRQRKRNQ